MTKPLFYITLLIISILWSCQNTPKPTEQEVLTAVQNYLDNNVAPNHIIIQNGSMSFASAGAKELLSTYESLSKEGYIRLKQASLAQQKSSSNIGLIGEVLPDADFEKKKIYHVSLESKADTLIIKKNNNKYLIKSSQLSTKAAQIESIEARAGNTYRITILLSWQKTPFSRLENLDNIPLKHAYLLQQTADGKWKIEGEVK